MCKAWAEDRSLHMRICKGFRVLKLGLTRGARVGRFNQEGRHGLGIERSHLLVYRKLSFILEPIRGCKERIYSLIWFVTLIIKL